MQEYKVAINKNTNETRLLLYEDEELVDSTIIDNEYVVTSDGYVGLLKPSWDGEKWIESATEEELIKFNECSKNSMIFI